MPENTDNIIRRMLPGLIFGFLVFLVIILIGDIQQVSDRVIRYTWRYYPLVLLLTLFNYLLRFFKWHFYLDLVGVRDYPVVKSARLFLAGFPLAVTPGKVGEALKGVWLQKETGLAVTKGISVVLAERISDGLGVLLLSTLGVIAYPRYWPAFAAVFGGLLLLILIIQIRPAALWMLDLGTKLPLIKRFSSELLDFYEGSYLLFRPRAILIAVSLGIISWLGEGIGMYYVLIGLGVPSGWETLSIAVFVLAFSTVVGAVSALPGGLGAADASIAGMLTILLGLTKDTSAAATLLIRFATLWFAVLIGLCIWVIAREFLFDTERSSQNDPLKG
jgi:uncharacterized protein (TIRG00374 family)